MRTFRGLGVIRTVTTVAALATVILAGVFTVFRADACVAGRVGCPHDGGVAADRQEDAEPAEGQGGGGRELLHLD